MTRRDAYSKPFAPKRGKCSVLPARFKRRVCRADGQRGNSSATRLQAQSFAASLDAIAAAGRRPSSRSISRFSTPLPTCSIRRRLGRRAALPPSPKFHHRASPKALHPGDRDRIIGSAASLSALPTPSRVSTSLMDLKRAAEPMLAGLDMLCVPTMPTFYSTRDDLAADPIGPELAVRHLHQFRQPDGYVRNRRADGSAR